MVFSKASLIYIQLLHLGVVSGNNNVKENYLQSKAWEVEKFLIVVSKMNVTN